MPTEAGTAPGADVQCPGLAYGSAGVCAAVLQKQLNDHGAGLVVDGIAGPRTQASLIAEAPPPG
ncbi:hypothetical protein ABZ543_20665 [Streptomyces roseifaciens]